MWNLLQADIWKLLNSVESGCFRSLKIAYSRRHNKGTTHLLTLRKLPGGSGSTAELTENGRGPAWSRKEELGWKPTKQLRNGHRLSFVALPVYPNDLLSASTAFGADRASPHAQHQVIPGATHALTNPSWDDAIINWFADRWPPKLAVSFSEHNCKKLPWRAVRE